MENGHEGLPGTVLRDWWRKNSELPWWRHLGAKVPTAKFLVCSSENDNTEKSPKNNKIINHQTKNIYVTVNMQSVGKIRSSGGEKATGSAIMLLSPPQRRMKKTSERPQWCWREKQINTRIRARETRASGQKMIREPQQRTCKRNEFPRPVKSEFKINMNQVKILTKWNK